MLKVLIATGALVAVSLPATAGSWTATGSNGGSGSGGTTCERGDGATVCTTTGSWVGADGKTKTWSTERRYSRGSVEATKDVTGFNGRERSFGWTRQRTN